jgi:hypothetical protein
MILLWDFVQTGCDDEYVTEAPLLLIKYSVDTFREGKVVVETDRERSRRVPKKCRVLSKAAHKSDVGFERTFGALSSRCMNCVLVLVFSCQMIV